MNKQKSKQNSCDKLKAKVKQLKKDWHNGQDEAAELRKEYKKQRKEFKALLAPFKADWKKKRKTAKKLKKKYKTAKTDFNTNCQPKMMGEVLMVWRAAEDEQIKQSKKKAKSRTKKTDSDKSTAKTSPSTTPVAKQQPEIVETPQVQKIIDDTTTSAVTVAAAKAVAPTKDNLKRVEGIGPKIEQLLQEANIHTFEQLAEASVETLREILAAAGPRFRMHSPDTWARQAAIAARGDWDALKTWQDQLKGGRE